MHLCTYRFPILINQHLCVESSSHFPKENTATFHSQRIQGKVIHHRNLCIFLVNHGPFSVYFYKIKRSTSPYCDCRQLTPPLHYVLQCILASAFHIRKPQGISHQRNAAQRKESTYREQNNTIRYYRRK